MKQVVSTNADNAITVTNLLKKGINRDRVIAYKRKSFNGKDEYAFLRRIDKNTVGFISLMGGPDYEACMKGENYKTVLNVVAKHRKLYVFKNLQDFVNNCHKMVAQ